MAATTSLTTNSTKTFQELTDSVNAFTAEIEAKETIAPNGSVTIATLLLIAIENAANIFKDCTPDRQTDLAGRVELFKKMIASLKKTDWCRLNLPTCIRHTIDEGTSDGWFPKLYGVNPQYVVPKAETMVQFFGKFKYAEAKHGKTYLPTLKVGEQTFEPTEWNQHELTFKVTFSPDKTPYQKDRCSHFDSRLIVPYESGNLGMVFAQKRTFEFNVPIRTLPINAGVIMVVSKTTAEPQVAKMEWEDKRIYTLDSRTDSKLTFISFDTRQQEFTAAQLEAEAEKVFPKPLTIEGSYLKISQVATSGGDKYKWQVETVPPIGI